MSWCRALPPLTLVLLVVLLAGCSSQRTRPYRAGHGVVGHGVAGRASPRQRPGVNDDLSRAQGTRYRDSSDSVPGGPPPDLSMLHEPVPQVEPRSLYGNKSPYTVLGKTYRVLPTERGYDERGIASFYGNKFHGYKTSSLETYDMYAFTAASKTLPLPSYARVTNLQNGKSVVVRVNDRGPFHDNRLIDLSYVAAVKIGIWPSGTGLVEVRALDPRHPGDAPPPAAVVNGRIQPATSGIAPGRPTSSGELSANAPVPVVGPTPSIYLQVGAFSDASNAERVAQRLRQAKLGTVRVVKVTLGGRAMHRVQVGPLADVDEADHLTDRIEAMGLPRPQVAVD